MKTIVLASALGLIMLASAGAAVITNKDGEAHVLIVAEGSDKVEVVVEAGATTTFCAGGCFVTMPSGDRETLSGDEVIEIVNGGAVIK